jgi:hypothetical protein
MGLEFIGKASENEANFRVGLAILSCMIFNSSPLSLPFFADLIRKHVLPLVHPLKNWSRLTLFALTQLFTSPPTCGVGANPRMSQHLGQIIFEEVFDKEYESCPDEIGCLLPGVIHAMQTNLTHFVPFIADRIPALLLLSNRVQTKTRPDIDGMADRLGALDWPSHPESLKKAVRALRSLYPNAPWFVQQSILMFVHMLLFAHLFALPREIMREIFDQLLPQFVDNPRAELREGFARIVRMLIPVLWDDLGAFYAEQIDQKRGSKLAVANAVALIGAATVTHDCPAWLPDLFEFLERAHAKDAMYATLIKAECTAFWHRIGIKEIPEIEDYRYMFPVGYVA